MEENLKYIIESLLFVSDTPIMLRQIHNIMPDVSMSNIRKAVEELTHEYNERVGSFYLSNVAGGIQLRTRPGYREWIKRFIRSRPIRLSRAALEALAIVAYKQPVTRAEVDKIRGVDSGAIMRTLVENKLIRIIGRKEVAGRPMLYTTSRRFLEVFDLNDLKDLPAPDDLEIDDTDVKKEQQASAASTDEIHSESEDSQTDNNDALSPDHSESEDSQTENNDALSPDHSDSGDSQTENNDALSPDHSDSELFHTDNSDEISPDQSTLTGAHHEDITDTEKLMENIPSENQLSSVDDFQETTQEDSDIEPVQMSLKSEENFENTEEDIENANENPQTFLDETSPIIPKTINKQEGV